MRYTGLAYGTRAEIQEEIRRGLSGQRSERRQRESEKALEDLEHGDFSVTVGEVTFLVEEES